MESSDKKTKKLLAGYERIIRTKVEEINNLQKEYEKVRLERLALENITTKERSSMDSRICEL